MSEVVEVSYGPNGEMYLHLRKVAPSEMPAYHKQDQPQEEDSNSSVVIIDMSRDDLEEFSSNKSVIIYEM